MNKTEEYLSYIEDSLKLDSGNGEEMHKRLIKIWSRLSEYLYYSDVTFEKFNREMGYDHFYNEDCSSCQEEDDEEKEEEQDDDYKEDDIEEDIEDKDEN